MSPASNCPDFLRSPTSEDRLARVDAIPHELVDAAQQSSVDNILAAIDCLNDLLLSDNLLDLSHASLTQGDRLIEALDKTQLQRSEDPIIRIEITRRQLKRGILGVATFLAPSLVIAFITLSNPAPDIVGAIAVVRTA